MKLISFVVLFLLITTLTPSMAKVKGGRGPRSRSEGSGPKKTSHGSCSSKKLSSSDSCCCGVGPAGSRGPTGPVGPAGVQGVQGVQGVEGAAGQSGAPGVEGEKGDKGEKGNRGFKGRKGDPGEIVIQQQQQQQQQQAAAAAATRRHHVAFSVTMDEEMPQTAEYRVVKYNIVLTNYGSAYNMETGLFTSPLNGTFLVGFGGVSQHGHDILLHLNKNGQRILSAFDNSGCTCCGKSSGKGKCAGSGSNVGILSLDEGDQLWIELPDKHGMHNAPYHNYGTFYGYLLFTAQDVIHEYSQRKMEKGPGSNNVLPEEGTVGYED